MKIANDQIPFTSNPFIPFNRPYNAGMGYMRCQMAEVQAAMQVVGMPEQEALRFLAARHIDIQIIRRDGIMQPHSKTVRASCHPMQVNLEVNGQHVVSAFPLGETAIWA